MRVPRGELPPVAEPAPVAHLDCVPEIGRQTFQEIFEHAHSFDGERRRELYEERAEPVAEFGHRPYEVLGLAFGANQVLIVCDLLGVLYTTHKHAHSHRRGREGMSIAPG